VSSVRRQARAGCAARNEAHLRGGVVDAVEIDGLNKIAIAANQVCSIVRH
jgi:hypothetical protein